MQIPQTSANPNRPFFYTVLEIQELPSGARACVPPVIYSDYDEAVAHFFQVCAAAAKSAINYHSAHVLRSDGMITDYRIFDRRGDL